MTRGVRGGLLLALAASLAAEATLAAGPPEASSDAEHYLDRFVDRTADPRTDFNQFAVGKWLKENPIPTNERSWGIASIVQEETYRRLIGINEEQAATQAAPGSNAQKIGDFWAAAMDSAAVAQEGFSPLQAEFDRIAAIRTRKGLLTAATSAPTPGRRASGAST